MRIWWNMLRFCLVDFVSCLFLSITRFKILPANSVVCELSVSSMNLQTAKQSPS